MATQFQLRNSIPLPSFPKPPPAVANQVAEEWLAKFASVLRGGDVSLLHTVLHDESWWRDALVISWDYHTVHGLAKIASFLQHRLSDIGFANLKLREQGAFTPNQVTVTKEIGWIESIFDFDTAIGVGRGILRLTADADGNWKAYTIYTSLQELKGHEWNLAKRRPHGGKNTLEGGIIKGNWYERRQREKDFLDEEPTCLIIGAGMRAKDENYDL